MIRGEDDLRRRIESAVLLSTHQLQECMSVFCATNGVTGVRVRKVYRRIWLLYS